MRWWIAWSAGAVYATLSPPFSKLGDSSELTLVLATGGVAHPTGYPLYTLLGHLFCRALHALGMGWPLAAALWSALGAVVAVWFLVALADEWTSRLPAVAAPARVLAIALPISLFVLQPVVLEEATRAEINSWSLAWGAAAAFVFVRLAAAAATIRPGSPVSHGAAARWGLVCGIGLAHHLTSILLSAPLSAALVLLLARRRALAPRAIATTLGAALVPLASVLWIAWRAWHPGPVHWPHLDASGSSVIAHLTGSGYRHYLGEFAPSGWQAGLLVRFVYPTLAIGLTALVRLIARARSDEERLAGWALLAGTLATVGFAFRYGVDDPVPYFLAPMGIGAAAVAPALASIGRRSETNAIAGLALAAAASFLLLVPWIRDGLRERSATISYERMIRSMWSSIPADTAIVSWTDDGFHRLRQYQILRGEKPALLVVTPDLLLGGRIREEIIRRFGADPREGFRPLGASARDSAALATARRDLLRRLNDRIRVPVILFDPMVPIVWQFPKPGERAP
jgi:hypothetical protein